MSLGPIVFVTWKWRADYRERFDAVHVNALMEGTARCYDQPHRFLCVTDSPEGVACETFPLWADCDELVNESGAHLPSCYRRLKLFDPATQEAMGIAPGTRIVSIDLDMVPVNDLGPLVDRPEDFIGWAVPGSVHPRVYNGSMWLVRAGSHAGVWRDFRPGSSPARAALAGYKGSDQAWLGFYLGPHKAGWTAHDGFLSFAGDVRHLGEVPEGARIISFHGKRKPWHEKERRRHLWIADHWIMPAEPEPPTREEQMALLASDVRRHAAEGAPAEVIYQRVRSRSRRLSADGTRASALDLIATLLQGEAVA